MAVNFLRGSYDTAKHTPGSAVTAGDVIEVGVIPMVAHHDIAASVEGALACGGGIYEGPGDAVIAVGKRVWWDGTSKFTETATSNPHFGYTVTACGGDGQNCEVRHDPDAISGS